MKQLILALTVLFGITSVITTQVQAQSALYSVTDGSLSDWGVTPGSDWNPNSGITYTVEDYIPGSNSDGFLGPGWGGQLFDAEGMYINNDSNYLYYAIVTGKPIGITSGELPGDISINFNKEGFKYGIAVPSFYSYSVAVGGAPYTAPEIGALYSVDPMNDTGTYDNGWKWSTWPNPADVVPVKINEYGGIMHNGKLGAQYLASGQLNYTNFTTSTGDKSHWIIEGYVPLSGFNNDWGKPFEMLWTQTCGNDVIRLNYTPIPHSPEPSTLIMLGLGLAGIIGKKLKNKKQ